MNFQTKSLVQQWILWAAATLLVIIVYVIVSCVLYGTVGLAVIEPQQQRIALPLLAILALFAWETRWDGTGRVMWAEPDEDGVIDDILPVPKSDGAPSVRATPVPAPAVEEMPAFRRRTPIFAGKREFGRVRKAPEPVSEPLRSGEELFEEARLIPHSEIPSFRKDGPYLDILGHSAAKGFAPAMAKLGEYAMRRMAWVEAYFWMAEARRHGMVGLEAVMRDIRTGWARDDFPEQEENVSRLFSREAGSVGRALLHIDSGLVPAPARDYLKENHPEYLENDDTDCKDRESVNPCRDARGGAVGAGCP